MQTNGSPFKGANSSTAGINQSDSIATKKESLGIFRSSRRKSIEENILMPNSKADGTESRAVFNKEIKNGSTTERNMDDTLNSKLNTIDDSKI